MPSWRSACPPVSSSSRRMPTDRARRQWLRPANTSRPPDSSPHPKAEPGPCTYCRWRRRRRNTQPVTWSGRPSARSVAVFATAHPAPAPPSGAGTNPAGERLAGVAIGDERGCDPANDELTRARERQMASVSIRSRSTRWITTFACGLRLSTCCAHGGPRHRCAPSSARVGTIDQAHRHERGPIRRRVNRGRPRRCALLPPGRDERGVVLEDPLLDAHLSGDGSSPISSTNVCRILSNARSASDCRAAW